MWGQPGRTQLAHIPTRQRGAKAPKSPSQEPMLVAMSSWGLGQYGEDRNQLGHRPCRQSIGLMTPTGFMEAGDAASQVEVRPLLPSHYQYPSWESDLIWGHVRMQTGQ